MKKYFILIASVFVNICFGGIYAWSVFVPELVQNYGYSTAQTQIVFGTIVCLLTITMLLTGNIGNILDSRLIIFICGLLIFTSYTIAGCSGTSFLALWFGYGVINGIAMGFATICILMVNMKWFEKKGFVCGMVATGYGLGSIILYFVSQTLLNHGWDVMNIFRIFGIIFGTVIFICATTIKNPDAYNRKTMAPTIKSCHIARRPRFYVLAITTGVGTFPGLMILGNLKPIVISLGYKSSMAILAISLISIGNAFGRIVGGAMHDQFKASAVKMILIMVSLSSLLLVIGGIIGWFFFLAVILFVGMSYGGLVANIPAQVADEYGHENFGMIYPKVILAHGLTGLFAAPFGGYIYDQCNTYQPAILLAAGIGSICLMCFSFAYRKTVLK